MNSKLTKCTDCKPNNCEQADPDEAQIARSCYEILMFLYGLYLSDSHTSVEFEEQDASEWGVTFYSVRRAIDRMLQCNLVETSGAGIVITLNGILKSEERVGKPDDRLLHVSTSDFSNDAGGSLGDGKTLLKWQ